MIRILTAIVVFITPVLLTGCGFKPLYATNDAGVSTGLRSISITDITADDSIKPFLDEAFSRRINSDDDARFDLYVEATERAERLAVQIDASVTRYNYRLVGRYTLVNRSSGQQTKGRINAVSSFNVVSSQYSTLFAEKTAREKAARTFVEEVERDILLKLEDRRR